VNEFREEVIREIRSRQGQHEGFGRPGAFVWKMREARRSQVAALPVQ